MTNPTIMPAKPADALLILECFKRCTYSLLEQHIDQWNYSYPLISHIHRDIQTKSCFVIKFPEGIGTITLNQEEDEQYANIRWNYNEKNIWVIHRLAVDPAISGRGIAKLLCKFAESIVRNKGGGAIHLDTYSLNPVSNRLYQSLGYQRADGICYFHGNFTPFYCYEKKILI